MGTCNFSRAQFEKKAVFHYTQVAKNMILRKTQFKGGLNLALINFIQDGYINPMEINIAPFKPSKKDADVDSDREDMEGNFKRS